MKAVIYARYSGDRQREASIDDQVRNCTVFAEREGISVIQVYQDKAITGAIKARPGYLRMVEDSAIGAFDILLVDDLSRLSRDDYEMKGLLRTFTWKGLRVIGVTDGYDSSRKGHKIHAGFKGLMNEMFLDDLRDRTHRGMTGQALKGFNCGGRTFGYRNIPIEDGQRKDAYGRPAIVAVRYEIDQAQAGTVRQIYAWFATGYSYKWIAAELNRQRIASSRGGSWAISAIKVLLENEMYEGRLIWNRREWVKHPETGKRTYKLRPRAEWIISQNENLRIVPADIIDAVRRRQQNNKRPDGFTPSNAQRYLFSGLMVCAECGGNFVTVNKNRYGCAAHKARGESICNNNITVSRHIIEERLLRSIKEQMLEPANIEKFKREALSIIEQQKTAGKEAHIADRIREVEKERQNIMGAIKAGIVTQSTKKALEEAENEIAGLKRQARDAAQWKVSGILPRAIERYQQAIAQLEQEFTKHIDPAREILKTLLGEHIRIHRVAEHLEAEIPNSVPVILAKTMNSRNDFSGCGGAIRTESQFISLAPLTRDSTPLSYRKERLKNDH